MVQEESVIQSKGFGKYLRRIREERRLSLDAVQEMSLGFPERVTKSHLSRIENGRAVPTFPRMFTLSQIYGVRVSSLADRFEQELQRGMTPVKDEGRSVEEIKREIRRLHIAGHYPEALALVDRLLERQAERNAEELDRDGIYRLRLDRVDFLMRLSRYGLAKDECEDILNLSDLQGETRLIALETFAICCYRLGRFTVALMGLDQAERELASGDSSDKHRAELTAIRGNVLSMIDRFEEASVAYKKAIEYYEQLQIPFEACRLRVNLGSVLIELDQDDAARRLLHEAVVEAEAGGYERQRSLALSNLGMLEYKTANMAEAESLCIRSNAIARPREYLAIVFRNCFYLWKIAIGRGDAASVVTNERTLKTYVGRVEESLGEVDEFRAYLSGDKS